MKYYYDLHVHSCLSPCADVLMTPNNILNMATLKNLDIIAICDHNSTRQLKIFEELATSFPILIVPGIEVTAEVYYHVTCYFPSFQKAYEFQTIHDENYPKVPFNNSLMSQDLCDINDEVIDHYPYNLHEPSYFTIKSLKEIVHKLGGKMVLAHIERYGDNVYDADFVDMFDAIEINIKTNEHPIIKKYPHLLNKIILRDSDAHSLEIICEKDINDMDLDYEPKILNQIELDTLTLNAFIDYFK